MNRTETATTYRVVRVYYSGGRVAVRHRGLTAEQIEALPAAGRLTSETATDKADRRCTARHGRWHDEIVEE